MVRIEGLTKRFGEKTALENVTWSVPRGRICGLLGPNGAGKTTLFRLLMGILKATEGSLNINGLDCFEERVRVKRLVGFLPDGSLNGIWTSAGKNGAGTEVLTPQ